MTTDELAAAWNAQADELNQFDTLGLDEIVAFAQLVERERCACVAEETAAGRDAEAIAEAIRKQTE